MLSQKSQDATGLVVRSSRATVLDGSPFLTGTDSTGDASRLRLLPSPFSPRRSVVGLGPCSDPDSLQSSSVR